MYFYLTGALKERIILELRECFSRHPVYRKIVPCIQNRYSFEERPEYGIVVKGSSANKVQLDAGNFMGTLESHVMLAQVGQMAFPLEWVREDTSRVRAHNGMPTPPGVYYLEILSAPRIPGEKGYFAIDPLLTVTDEPLVLMTSGFETEAQLQAVPLERTLRVFQGRNRMLVEGEDYELHPQGVVRFLRNFPKHAYISADYRYPGESLGPLPFEWNRADTTTLPGVVLAFGKRAEKGQKVAVVVYRDRVSAAQVHGGKSEVNLELDILARDTTQVGEIADLTKMYLWGEKKPALEFEGIEIIDVSIGGEGEEPIDESGQNFQYTVSVSLQLRADWEIHIPLPLTISRLEPQVSQVQTSAFFEAYPVIAGRNPDYERIG